LRTQELLSLKSSLEDSKSFIKSIDVICLSLTHSKEIGGYYCNLLCSF